MAVATKPKKATKIGAWIKIRVRDGVVPIFSDAHFWPKDRSVAYEALLRFIDDNKPPAVINDGDSLDAASISRHPPVAWAKNPDVAEELEYCKDRLGEIEDVTPDDSDLIWCMGNHDSRWSMRLAQVAPEFKNVKGFDLVDHFPAWQFGWSCQINNDVVVKHRWKGGSHAAFNNAKDSGKTMVTGHLHRLVVSPYNDYTGTRYGVDCGTLSTFGPRDYKFIYAENAPLNWGQGFAVLTFENGKLLPPELARVQGNRCIFRGKAI